MTTLLRRAEEDPDEHKYGGAGSYHHARFTLFHVTPEVTAPNLALTLLPIFITVFGTISAIVKERLYAGEAIVATVWGIILSPSVADLFHPSEWTETGGFNEITLVVTRIVIAISVFAVGVELPRAYMKRHWKSVAMLLGPNMIAGWLISAAFMYILLPTLGFLHCMVIAAALSPTDPVLAASVVGKGKFAQEHVPSHIRHLLQSESGCNDGAAFPFLYIAIYMIMRQEDSVGLAIGKWIYLVILYQIVLGIIIGAVVGILSRKALKFAKRRQYIDRESMVAMYVSLALFTTGVTTLAGSDDLLAAFACGAAFAWDDWFTESIEDSNFSNIVDLLINSTIFMYIGATMPFDDWNSSELNISPWRLVVLAIAILFLRRLPCILLLYRWIPDIKTFREALFCGHFGPMGVGAVFIGTLAQQRLPTPNVPPQTQLDYLSLSIQPVIYFIVLSSVLIHGLSIPFFSLGKRVHSISRTWTRDAGEPSWLHRVKRYDDENEEDAIRRNIGPIIGHGPINGDLADHAESGDLYDEKEKQKEEDQEELEKEEQEPSEDTLKSEAKGKELDTETWREGERIVIDRNKGEDVDVYEMPRKPHGVLKRGPSLERLRTPSPKPSEKSKASSKKRTSRPSSPQNQNIGGSTNKDPDDLTSKIARSATFWKEPALSPEQIERDRAFMRERRDCDRAPAKTWIQGNTMIIERNGGEDVEVVDLDKSNLPRPQKQASLYGNITKWTGLDQSNRKRSRSVGPSSVGGPGLNIFKLFSPLESNTKDTRTEQGQEQGQSSQQSSSSESAKQEYARRRQSREMHTESSTFRNKDTSPLPVTSDAVRHNSTSALVGELHSRNMTPKGSTTALPTLMPQQQSDRPNLVESPKSGSTQNKPLVESPTSAEFGQNVQQEQQEGSSDDPGVTFELPKKEDAH